MGLHVARSVLIINDPEGKGNGETEVSMFTCPHCLRVLPLGRHIGPDGSVREGAEGGVCRKHMRVICKAPGCHRDCTDRINSVYQGR